MRRLLYCSLALFVVFSFSQPALAEEAPAGVPDPESVFGFQPGADR